MHRAVFDTNVYVSAYGFGGLPAQLMRAAIIGELEIATSPAILAELARVLADKLEFDAEHVEAVVLQVSRIAHVVRPHVRLRVIADDPDNRVLECAVASGADTIVSGDRDPLALGDYEGVHVCSGRRRGGIASRRWSLVRPWCLARVLGQRDAEIAEHLAHAGLPALDAIGESDAAAAAGRSLQQQDRGLPHREAAVLVVLGRRTQIERPQKGPEVWRL